MSSDISVRCDDLGKQYRIGAFQGSYRTLRDQIASTVAAPWRRLAAVVRGDSALASKEHIWALKGISFEVRVGEALGIIGHNGAGKTTLLKLLSRVTEPTTGSAEIRGTVGSLLEVGTGFHPELTGRENVFLNGAILGMKRAEIEGKFDQIVDFAEISKFIDTPVKHYSSGMYVRLAFAVAAHLEPQVLLIDEVLAVGDVAFQRKCIATLRDTTQRHSTALVVSHNMALVRSLCNRVLLLSGGRVVADGSPADVIRHYHKSLLSAEATYEAPAAPVGKSAWVARALLRDGAGNASSEIPCGEAFRVDIGVGLANGTTIRRPWMGVRIYTSYGDLVSHVANREAGFELPAMVEPTTVFCELIRPTLLPGQYSLGIVLADADNTIYDRVEQAMSFTVTQADVFNSGILPRAGHGQVFVASRWRAEATGEPPQVPVVPTVQTP